jgi:nitrous oxidase accessory protein NosD
MTGLIGIVITPDGSIAQTAQPMQIAGNQYYLPGNTLVSSTGQPIHRSGSTYTITGNIINYSLVIERSNIVIDGSGFSIQPLQPSSNFYNIGITLPNVSNVTINNFEIGGFSVGIQLSASTNCKITNNAIKTIPYSSAYPNENGIALSGSWNNLVTANTLENGGISVFAFSNYPSYNNTFSSNILHNCNFAIDGDWLSPASLSDYMNSIDASNLVNGKPVCYLVNQTSLTIDSKTYPEIGFLALVNCRNMTVENLVFANMTANIVFAYLNNSRILSNDITCIRNGIDVLNCSSNLIKGNTITVPFDPEYYQNYVLTISDSSNNTVTGNTIRGGYFGLLLGDGQSTENNIYANNVSQKPTTPSVTPIPTIIAIGSLVPILATTTIAVILTLFVSLLLCKRHRKTANSKQ